MIFLILSIAVILICISIILYIVLRPHRTKPNTTPPSTLTGGGQDREYIYSLAKQSFTKHKGPVGSVTFTLNLSGTDNDTLQTKVTNNNQKVLYNQKQPVTSTTTKLSIPLTLAAGDYPLTVELTPSYPIDYTFVFSS
jgi:hypothetical protein